MEFLCISTLICCQKKPHGTTPSGGYVEANPYFLCGVIPSSRVWSPLSPFAIIRVPLSSDRKSRIPSFLVVFLSVQRHVICRAVGWGNGYALRVAQSGLPFRWFPFRHCLWVRNCVWTRSMCDGCKNRRHLGRACQRREWGVTSDSMGIPR